MLRDGKEVTLKVKLDSASDSDVPTEAQQAKSKGRLGVSVRPLSDEEKKKFGDGLFVVSSEGAAAKAGIKEGDVLLSVGGKKIRSFDQFKKAVENAKDTLALQVAREGSRIYVAVKLDDKEKKEEKK